MLQARDWISCLVGLILGMLGFLPFLHSIGKGPEWFALSWLPLEILSYLIAAGGFYLITNSIIEITNSNVLGWVSFFAAAAITLTGVLKVLGQRGVISGFFAIGWLSPMVYYFIFMTLGLFLIIATFAMEL